MFYSRYSQALSYVGRERNLLSYVLVKAEPRSSLDDLADRIESETALRAATTEDFKWQTIGFYLKNTGIPVNFGITIARAEIGAVQTDIGRSTVRAPVGGEEASLPRRAKMNTQTSATMTGYTASHGAIPLRRISNDRVPAFGCLMLMLLSGCAVGPDYRPPEFPVPSHYRESLTESLASRSSSLANWWQNFRGQPLDRLMAKALRSNRDLRIAETRVREARALRNVVSAGFWPTVDASAGYTRLRTSTNGPTGLALARGLLPVETDLYQAALDATWELDIFGGTRRAVEAAEAEIGASEEDRRDVLVTLLGEVGLNYIELRGLQKENAVTRSNLDAQEQPPISFRASL